MHVQAQWDLVKIEERHSSPKRPGDLNSLDHFQCKRV